MYTITKMVIIAKNEFHVPRHLFVPEDIWADLAKQIRLHPEVTKLSTLDLRFLVLHSDPATPPALNEVLDRLIEWAYQNRRAE